ncbi:Guanine nucleotide binding protein (G protein), beta polypeptide 1-like [Halocaridina rubra]|uniref:Guanine nucleotide binding protein (G protein), beta polypeptide 1-like n=1 Tax=Halocaridina rubra TaxID=373956 RepID=A0AAN8XHJ2_HALRR
MNRETPDPIFVFRGARSPVASLTFLKAAEDGFVYSLAAGTQEGQLLIWDLKSKCIIKDFPAHPASSILWLHSESPNELWTLGRHDKVKCWDIGQQVPYVRAEYSLSDYLGFSQCHMITVNSVSLLAIPGPSMEGVTVYDAQKRVKICTLSPKDPKKSGTLMQMQWVNEMPNIYLLVAYESGHLSLWDHNEGNILSEIQFSDNPICFSYNPVTRIGILGSTSEKIFVFNIDADLRLHKKEDVIITNPGVGSCVDRPDGKIFVAGGWDFRIRFFSSKKMKPLAVLMYHKKTVRCLAYSPSFVKSLECEFLLAAGSDDMSVSLWNLFN